jgi:hypothetical protein
VVPFGGVIEHDVENHLDARAVQRLDHVAKLVDGAERIPTRAVVVMRREKRHGRIAPVVHQPGRTILWIELEYRHELHCGDAQPLEVRNLLDEAGERAASRFREARARMPGEAAHVHLVHDRA